MRKRYCVDKGFKSLIPPLSEAERSQLEESCIKYGIKDSIKIWNLTIVDGHNRYEIAQKHKLPFKVDKMDFKTHEEAELWIVENQFGRRNLSPYDRCVLALKLKPSFIKRAKANQARTAENRENQKSDKQRMNTNKELAKIAGVSHDTIHKVDVIEKHGDQILIEQIRKGDVSINEAYNKIKPPKKPVSPKTRDVVVNFPVAKETVVEQALPFEEITDDVIEDDAEKPVSETSVAEEPLQLEESAYDVSEELAHTFDVFDATPVAELGRAIEIMLDLKGNYDLLIDGIKKAKTGSEKEVFKKQLADCGKFLSHIDTMLIDW